MTYPGVDGGGGGLGHGSLGAVLILLTINWLIFPAGSGGGINRSILPGVGGVVGGGAGLLDGDIQPSLRGIRGGGRRVDRLGILPSSTGDGRKSGSGNKGLHVDIRDLVELVV